MEGKRGKLVDVIKGTDVFIGVSSAGALHAHWVSSMNKDSIVLAMANPIP
jgi:malate dehydrogenase (oxaloacetate-decarboxylating)